MRIGDDDELGSYIFRTAGFNSIRTLATRLKYFEAVSGGRLACLALELRLRGKSTTQSHRSAVYYVDLVTRPDTTLAQALADSKAVAEERFAAGFDQKALDEAARRGLAHGAFEESPEEGAAVVEEFYPPAPAEAPEPPAAKSLSSRLQAKAAALMGQGDSNET